MTPHAQHSSKKIYKNFIDGQWADGATGRLFANKNPAKPKDLIGYFQRSAQSDIRQAVMAAQKAHLPWKRIPAPKRAEILYAPHLFYRNKKRTWPLS